MTESLRDRIADIIGEYDRDIDHHSDRCLLADRILALIPPDPLRAEIERLVREWEEDKAEGWAPGWHQNPTIIDELRTALEKTEPKGTR